MSNKVVLLIIIILLVILGLIFWNPFGSNDDLVNVPPADVQNQIVTANHFYTNGTHTIEGTITLPTPCHELRSDVVIAESMPEQVTINFTTSNDTEICTQTIANKFFSVSFPASLEAIIAATLDGKPLALRLGDIVERFVK